jgi:uncharacterized coiled-coil protein SlyX
MLQLSVEDYFKQPGISEAQYHAAAHGESSNVNQQPGMGNNAHMNGIHDVLQVIKEIQASLKTDLDDIRRKVDFLYAKFNDSADNNQTPPNPTTHSPPPQPSRPPSIPTLPKPIVEVSSTDTRTLPQHHQNISKATPSSMNPPIQPTLEEKTATDSPMEEDRIEDLYGVPVIRTVPSLLDEV